MNGCPNNKFPLENCYPNTPQAVIPSYGGDGYYCYEGNCSGSQVGTVSGYRTLGNYGGQGANCCNPQITPLCKPDHHMMGAKEQHTCKNGKKFMCSGGTQMCYDDSPMYCNGSRPMTRPMPRPMPRPMSRPSSGCTPQLKAVLATCKGLSAKDQQSQSCQTAMKMCGGK